MQMSAAAAAKERRERMASPRPAPPPAPSSCPGGARAVRAAAVRRARFPPPKVQTGIGACTAPAVQIKVGACTASHPPDQTGVGANGYQCFYSPPPPAPPLPLVQRGSGAFAYLSPCKRRLCPSPCQRASVHS